MEETGLLMIRFRKLYTRNDADGYYPDSIIVFSKKPYLQKTTDQGDGTEGLKTSYIAQYQRRLYIDCWLFMIKLEWLTRELP